MICDKCKGAMFTEVETFDGIIYVCHNCGNSMRETEQVEIENHKGFSIYGFYDIIETIKGFFGKLTGRK